MDIESNRSYTVSLPSRLEVYATIFRRHLTSEWTRKKKPYGLDEAFIEAHSLPRGTTEKIFLDAGFQAWISYYLATNIAGAHYKGKTADLKLIESLNQLLEEDRRAIATELASTVPHITAHNAIERLNPSKRRRLGTACSEDLLAASITSDTNHQSTIMDNAGWMSQPSAQHAQIESLTPQLGEQRLEHATYQGTATIFPQYMCSAIRKTGMGVAVTMLFPYAGQGGIDCFMTLSIFQNKLEYIAMKLLGVHLEVDNDMRYVFSNGVRMLPRPEVSLQGAHDEAISELLGSTIASALAASPIRKEEVKHAIHATTCVTLTISNNAHEDGILNLNLNLEEGIGVREILYRPHQAATPATV